MRYQTHAKTRRQGSEEKAVKRGRAELRVGEKVGVSREDTQGRHSLGQARCPLAGLGYPDITHGTVRPTGDVVQLPECKEVTGKGGQGEARRQPG